MMGLLPRSRIFIDAIGPEETEALANIHADAFAHGWHEDDFAGLIADRRVMALGLRKQSVFGFRRLLGFCLIRTAADEAEVLTIAVSPTQRGRGFGRMLMEEALRRLYRERVAACFLEVDRGNVAALALYRSLGFLDVGQRKGYYRPPDGSDGTALVMRAQLR
jgi:[ribosomal protein S18]-alanine N-acetyltransferase